MQLFLHDKPMADTIPIAPNNEAYELDSRTACVVDDISINL